MSSSIVQLLLDSIQFVLAGFLTFTCFCRLRATDDRTVDAIRHAFALMATVMLAIACSTFFLHAYPLLILALIGISCVQAVTAIYWGDGVPHQFVKERYRFAVRRRATDHRDGYDGH